MHHHILIKVYVRTSDVILRYLKLREYSVVLIIGTCIAIHERSVNYIVYIPQHI